MTIRGAPHREIMKILQVCSGFISKWKPAFVLDGVKGLKLGHKGSKGYLTPKEKPVFLLVLKNNNTWNLNQLECYMASKLNETFVAKSSYYDLFHEAGVSRKKSQKKNPGKDEEAVEIKKRDFRVFR